MYKGRSDNRINMLPLRSQFLPKSQLCPWASISAKALINLCCISYTTQNTVINLKTNHAACHVPHGFLFVFQLVMPEMLQAYQKFLNIWCRKKIFNAA